MGSKRKRESSKNLEFDFHGLSALQARDRLERILTENSGKAGQEITIIHGKGNGILAQEVASLARSDPRIACAERSFFNEGITTLILSGKRGKPASPATASPLDWERYVPPPVRKRKR